MSSRFEGDLQPFCEAVEAVGFKRFSLKTDMTHFVEIMFDKVPSNADNKSKAQKKKMAAKKSELTLAPCLYKRR